MANFNKVMLIGNLTRDPELRYAGGGGTAICKFGLATNRQWRNNAGEQQEETCFVDIVVFGRQAETCNEYLRKGRSVFIDGRLSFSSWEDRETGNRRSKLEVVAERVQFLGGRDSGGGHSGGGYRESEPRSRPAAPARAGTGGQSGQSAPQSAPAGGGIDFDDIPF